MRGPCRIHFRPQKGGARISYFTTNTLTLQPAHSLYNHRHAYFATGLALREQSSFTTADTLTLQPTHLLYNRPSSLYSPCAWERRGVVFSGKAGGVFFGTGGGA